MNKKLIFVFLLFALLYIDNVNSADLKPIKTYINTTIIAFGEGNNTSFNLSIITEDEIINIDNINKNSNINQKNLIVLIREIDVNQTEINNLTMECLKRVATIDSDALIACRESKARQFDTIQTIQLENSNLKGFEGNFSICSVNLAETQNNLGNCSATVGNLRNEVNSTKNNALTWSIIAILGISLIIYFSFKRKYGGASSTMETHWGRKTTAEPDYPQGLKDELKNIGDKQ